MVATTAFGDGGVIPTRFTQDVATPISPKLDWTNVPAGTVTFALIMRDPDTSVNRTTEEILLHCKERLADFKVPAHVEIRTDPLPRNASGKLLKNVLRGEGEVSFAETM